jgi:quinol monooxygenase YgiN
MGRGAKRLTPGYIQGVPKMALTILAQITATEGNEAALRAALERLREPTLAEAGCLFYDLHIDNKNPGFFVFYEAWETRDHWQAHNKAPHLAAFRIAREGLVASTVVHELTKLD